MSTLKELTSRWAAEFQEARTHLFRNKLQRDATNPFQRTNHGTTHGANGKQWVLYHPFVWAIDTDAKRFEEYWKRHYPSQLPPGHAQRCWAIEANSMRRCSNRRNHGRFCAPCVKWHKKNGDVELSFYGKMTGGKLQQMLEDAANMPDEQRLTLENEINLSRVSAAEAVKLLALLTELEDPKEKGELLPTAISALSAAVRNVSDVVEKHSRIMDRQDSSFSPGQLSWALKTVKRIVENSGMDAKKMKETLDEIDRMQLPGKAVAEASKIVID